MRKKYKKTLFNIKALSLDNLEHVKKERYLF